MPVLSDDVAIFLKDIILPEMNLTELNISNKDEVVSYIYSKYEAPFRIKEMMGQELTNEEIFVYNIGTRACREIKRRWEK